MNILIDALPTHIDGYEIYPNFRNMIIFNLLMKDSELSDTEKVFQAIDLLYIDKPQDIAEALKGLRWFYSCGKETDDKGTGKDSGSPEQTFCFEQDSSLIFSAFMAQYNINLQTVEHLHWWEFMALFRGINNDYEIKQAMYYRTCDTSKMSKEQRTHAKKMRELYRLLKPDDTGARLTLAERNEDMKERVRRRHEGIAAENEG